MNILRLKSREMVYIFLIVNLSLLKMEKIMTLKEFLDKYGVDTTSNFQLIHWAKEFWNKELSLCNER